MTNWTARLLARSIDIQLKKLGVSAGMMPVFTALWDGGGLSQKALTEAAAVEQPTMAATLVRMERGGLIERRRDAKDGRVQLFALTHDGLSKLPDVRRVAEAVNAGACRDLDAEDQATLLRLLGKVAAALEEDLGLGPGNDPHRQVRHPTNAVRDKE